MANLMEVIITPLYPADDGVMTGAHAPYRFLRAVIQAGRLAVRQADVKMIVKLAVGKDLYIHFPDAIYQCAAVKLRTRK
ncbi:hypothetical protein [Cronobacter sakazakii]|uniref:hypothetical protein n=1 Tax=Cronobacter sakazakii TaxID=28141 RepID=UPI001E5B02FB|nr:hypothetical protein [Cronobacter sakazakii]